MNGKIYMLKDDDELVEMNEKKHAREIEFQKLLEDYPSLLAGDQIDREYPRRWLLVSREMGLPYEEKGAKKLSLDHLFLDQDGIPTLVEVKRGSDTRLRREVIAQMLDYAANAVLYLPVEEIREKIDAQYDDLSLNEDFLEDDVDEERFWQTVKTNLQAGKIRMLFVADEIPNELISIVEFLNNQMNPAEVLAVEIKQYVDDDHKIKTLVPHVIGQTMEAKSKKGVKPSEPLLEPESFMDNLDSNGKIVFKKVLEFAAENDLKINWGGKGFSLNVVKGKKNVSLLRGYSKLYTYGQTLFSTTGSIKEKVEDGDKIASKYVSETLQLKEFEKVSNGFKLNIDRKIDDKEFEKFIAILTKTINKIRRSK